MRRVAELFKDGFEAEYSWITVDAKCGVTEEKQIAAINAGNPPDAFLSFGVDNVGKFCQSGAWVDLNDVHRRRGRIRPERVPRRGPDVHELRGHPVLAAVLDRHDGVYYNLDLFEKAGIDGPTGDDR